MTSGAVTDDIAQVCIDWMRRMNGVCLPEIEKWAARRGIPVRGDRTLDAGRENLVLWVGVSDQFCDLLNAVRGSAQVVLRPMSDAEALVVHGCYRHARVPALPTAKRPPSGGYREPHWLPTYWEVLP